MKRICVFCGSSRGGDPTFVKAAGAMGKTLAGRGLGLVYGGGNVGNAGAVTAEEEACHGHPWSAEFVLPPLSVVAFQSDGGG